MNTIGIGIVCLILPLLGSALFLDPACGIRAPIPTVPRIINGAIAPLRSSPWMAFLHTTDNYFVCGGTLITNRLVLTAAHCYLKNFTYTNLVARLGEYDRDDVEKCYGSYCTLRIEGKVDRGFKHRLFDPDTLAYDIALLRLKQRVEYRDNIRPICIVTDTSCAAGCKSAINTNRVTQKRGAEDSESTGIAFGQVETVAIASPGRLPRFVFHCLQLSNAITLAPSNAADLAKWKTNLCQGAERDHCSNCLPSPKENDDEGRRT
ncbi:GD23997 [Drosophila simulans]|uniref:GD23997 n=1 Tax=Drosophila simulans TaxID=7240 RepID=B4Q603_DROSI|nr:GD23997 [Drosophila simulans]